MYGPLASVQLFAVWLGEALLLAGCRKAGSGEGWGGGGAGRRKLAQLTAAASLQAD